MGMKPSVNITMPDVPAAWLSCEACYAAGKLTGQWYPITEIGDVTPADVHGHPTHHEEYVCMDTDGIPVDGEPSQAEAARWGELYEEIGEHMWQPFCAWVRSGSIVTGGDDMPDTSTFEERYQGEHEDFRDFAFQFAEDLDLFGDLPDDHPVVRYFNWNSWISDLEADFTVVRAPDAGVFVFRDQ